MKKPNPSITPDALSVHPRHEGRGASSDSEKLAIAAEIIKGRERLGLTQAQLAATSAVSLSAIKGYETGRSFPGARELRQLSLALGISPNVFLFGEEAPFSPNGTNEQASALPRKGPRVVRKRVTVLLDLLAAEECEAVYAIAHAIALARYGMAEVDARLEMADLAAGFAEIALDEPFDPELFRAVLKDRTTTRELVEALRAAEAEAEGTGPGFGTKKVVIR